MKRGRKYQGCGEEFNVEKKRKGKQYHHPFNIDAVGENIKLRRGEAKRTDNSGKKIKIKINEGGEEYQVVGTFIHP